VEQEPSHDFLSGVDRKNLRDFIAHPCH